MSRRDRDAPILVTDYDGEIGEPGLEYTIPTTFAVCPGCNGRGVHDCFPGGISAEQWAEDWDDESREGYFRGDYDRVCGECGGKRVVAVVDESRMSPELLKLWNEWQRDAAESRAIEAAERRAGA
jgi:hypothetical protein